MTLFQNEEVLLLQIQCKWCRMIFNVCRCCFCGQGYCCDQCRETARRIAHRRVQSEYRTSPKGRKTNRLAAQNRRIRAAQNHQIETNEKTVADRGTIWLKFCDMILFKFSIKESYCHFCGAPGKVVERFPHRGYSRKTGVNSSDSMKL